MSEFLWLGLLFAGHWYSSLLMQTFFLHRYASHRMFTMSLFWERFFYLLTWLLQGPSFLSPKAYAILHRLHHAHSDTPQDPHSPHESKGLWSMMWNTFQTYQSYQKDQNLAPKILTAYTPYWSNFEKVVDTHFWGTFVAGAPITLIYFALWSFTSLDWYIFLLLPLHWILGPIQGAIVNWCGHKYGYRNCATTDQSRNTLPWDFLLLGELFQNNHHGNALRPNMAIKWWELDPTWFFIWFLIQLKIIRLCPASRSSLQ
jgi:stearoyl-CoA desaturase (delta-9 desaturase)